MSGEHTTVVEIKNGERGELVKAIYQAIKYRALMMAKKGEGRSYSVDAYLVAYEMAPDIRNFAAKFKVQCYQVGRSDVDM